MMEVLIRRTERLFGIRCECSDNFPYQLIAFQDWRRGTQQIHFSGDDDSDLDEFIEKPEDELYQVDRLTFEF